MKKKNSSAKTKAVPKSLMEHLKLTEKMQVVNRAPAKFHIVAGKPGGAAAKRSGEVS
jgi:hypothetical protein